MSSHQPAANGEAKNLASQIAFDSLNERGAYVCNWSGNLLRVPHDGVQPRRSALLSVLLRLPSKKPLFVTKISDDPYISITKARTLAAKCDLDVSF